MGASDDIKKIKDIHLKIKSLFGIVSAILIVLCNYRAVIVSGALVNTAAFFVSVFVTDVKALIFLLGCCTAVGCNMIYLSLVVAVMEKCRKSCMMVVAIISAVQSSGVVIHILLKRYAFPHIGLTTAKSLTWYACGNSAACVLVGLAIVPGRLRMKDGGESFRSRALNLGNLAILKTWGIYALSSIFFFFTYSKDQVMTSISSFTTDQYLILANSMSNYGRMISSFTIFILSGGWACCCRKCKCCTRESCCCRVCVVGYFTNIDIGRIMAVLACSCVVLSLNCFSVFVFGVVAELSLSFAGVHGIVTGIVDPFLIVAVLAIFGEKHLIIGIGMTDFAAGLATLLGDELTPLVHEDFGPEAIYYIGIITFFMAAVSAIFLHRLHQRGIVIPMELDIENNDGQDKGKDETAKDDGGDAFEKENTDQKSNKKLNGFNISVMTVNETGDHAMNSGCTDKHIYNNINNNDNLGHLFDNNTANGSHGLNTKNGYNQQRPPINAWD